MSINQSNYSGENRLSSAKVGINSKAPDIGSSVSLWIIKSEMHITESLTTLLTLEHMKT